MQRRFRPCRRETLVWALVAVALCAEEADVAGEGQGIDGAGKAGFVLLENCRSLPFLFSCRLVQAATIPSSMASTRSGQAAAQPQGRNTVENGNAAAASKARLGQTASTPKDAGGPGLNSSLRLTEAAGQAQHGQTAATIGAAANRSALLNAIPPQGGYENCLPDLN